MFQQGLKLRKLINVIENVTFVAGNFNISHPQNKQQHAFLTDDVESL